MRERKELGVGDLPHDAMRNMAVVFDETKHEVVQDPETRLWSVYYKPRDRTVKRPIKREGREPYSYGKDARPIVITLLPGEMIETRLKGRRKGHLITWHDLHGLLARRTALTAIAVKRAERKARRAQRRQRK